MAYSPYTWQNGADGGTPITAYRLNQLETNLAAVSEVTDLVLPGETTEYQHVNNTQRYGQDGGYDNRLRWKGVLISPANFASATFAVILSTTPAINRSALWVITTGSSSIAASLIGTSSSGNLLIDFTATNSYAILKTGSENESIVRATVIKIR